jgi:hypothetical protein
VWTWTTAVRAAVRDPTTDGDLVTSYTADGSVERHFGPVGLRLSGMLADQRSDDVFQEARFGAASLGLVWYPLGRAVQRRVPTPAPAPVPEGKS